MTRGEKIATLKALRDEPNDQRQRTAAIHVLHGPSTAKMTETRRFIEYEIRRLEAEEHMAKMDAYVDD